MDSHIRDRRVKHWRRDFFCSLFLGVGLYFACAYAELLLLSRLKSALGPKNQKSLFQKMLLTRFNKGF